MTFMEHEITPIDARMVRNELRRAGALVAARYVARAIKSIEGAERHAWRILETRCSCCGARWDGFFFGSGVRACKACRDFGTNAHAYPCSVEGVMTEREREMMRGEIAERDDARYHCGARGASREAVAEWALVLGGVRRDEAGRDTAIADYFDGHDDFVRWIIEVADTADALFEAESGDGDIWWQWQERFAELVTDDEETDWYRDASVLALLVRARADVRESE